MAHGFVAMSYLPYMQTALAHKVIICQAGFKISFSEKTLVEVNIFLQNMIFLTKSFQLVLEVKPRKQTYKNCKDFSP